MQTHRVSIMGTFFACPKRGCNGVCRNGTYVALGHFVCEKCFARFRVVGEDEVAEVIEVTLPASTLAATEVLAMFGAYHMQQAYVDFHDAARKLDRVYFEVHSPRFNRNTAAYDSTKEACAARLRQDAARGGEQG